MRSQFSPLQVTGQINAASANFGSGQVIASDILSQGGLNITAHGDVFILPDDGKSLRVYSDMSMGGRDVLRVGDMIRLNGSGVVAVGSLEIDAELSRIRSVAGNITVASSDSVHFVKEGGGASNVLLVGESARLVLQGSEAFALVSKQEGALEHWSCRASILGPSWPKPSGRLIMSSFRTSLSTVRPGYLITLAL